MPITNVEEKQQLLDLQYRKKQGLKL